MSIGIRYEFAMDCQLICAWCLSNRNIQAPKWGSGGLTPSARRCGGQTWCETCQFQDQYVKRRHRNHNDRSIWTIKPYKPDIEDVTTHTAVEYVRKYVGQPELNAIDDEHIGTKARQEGYHNINPTNNRVGHRVLAAVHVYRPEIPIEERLNSWCPAEILILSTLWYTVDPTTAAAKAATMQRPAPWQECVVVLVKDAPSLDHNDEIIYLLPLLALGNLTDTTSVRYVCICHGGPRVCFFLVIF